MAGDRRIISENPQPSGRGVLQLRMEFRAVDQSLVVKLWGDLDLQTADGVRRALEGALEQSKAKDLYLDLSHVTFIDSSGLGMLLGRYKRVMRAGGVMGLINPLPVVRPILELSGLLKLMPVYETEPSILKETEAR